MHGLTKSNGQVRYYDQETMTLPNIFRNAKITLTFVRICRYFWFWRKLSFPLWRVTFNFRVITEGITHVSSPVIKYKLLITFWSSDTRFLSSTLTCVRRSFKINKVSIGFKHTSYDGVRVVIVVSSLAHSGAGGAHSLAEPRVHAWLTRCGGGTHKSP